MFTALIIYKKINFKMFVKNKKHANTRNILSDVNKFVFQPCR